MDFFLEKLDTVKMLDTITAVFIHAGFWGDGVLFHTSMHTKNGPLVSKFHRCRFFLF